MKPTNFYLLLLLSFLTQSCAKKLIDEDSFILSNGGKSMEIYISKGENLKTRLESFNTFGIENMVISGYIGGHTLSFLRELSGGNDSELLGGRNLGCLDIRSVYFYRSGEVYYVRSGKELKIETSGIPLMRLKIVMF